jgi:hypothetical protein
MCSELAVFSKELSVAKFIPSLLRPPFELLSHHWQNIAEIGIVKIHAFSNV